MMLASASALWLVAALGAADPVDALPDPTRPPGGVRRAVAEAAPAPLSLRLSAVKLGPDGAVARINGRTLRQGERVGELTVVRIALDGVELDGEQGRVHLRLGAGVKRPSAADDGESSR